MSEKETIEQAIMRMVGIDLNEFIQFIQDEINKRAFLKALEFARPDNGDELIRQFCEQVNDIACESMLKPPYKLEGQHKRAMVMLCKQLGITLTFGDENQ